MTTKRKLTAEEILKETQEYHGVMVGPVLQFSRQEHFDQLTMEKKEKMRIWLRDRYWKLREQLVSMFDTREASIALNDWLNSRLRKEEQLLLLSSEMDFPSKNTLKGFQGLDSEICEMETILLICQVAQEFKGIDCEKELSYRLTQLQAARDTLIGGKNPDEIQRTGSAFLRTLDALYLEKVNEIIKVENKAKEDDSKNTTDTKNVK